MSQITTHILDAALGKPAEGVAIRLLDPAGDVLAEGRTDSDGRIGDLGPDRLEPGRYRLEFSTADYFAATDRDTFYPGVSIDFLVGDAGEHYHVPLLLSPFAYSTYRGS
ncbi:hydroxyisourate hydrolase [Saxibacter everestensis]|uniref:5-hydroxyisourate hydrolase n=1 Tax=Saxibacter everestensis TaxID=2909229 RepID=A0ABY8QQY7_9MICO|nr:hydroxyisourate hydrolase [Brevibacteriaceae bacterium ZFBP1038]